MRPFDFNVAWTETLMKIRNKGKVPGIVDSLLFMVDGWNNKGSALNLMKDMVSDNEATSDGKGHKRMKQ
jgi:hypothetical protein